MPIDRRNAVQVVTLGDGRTVLAPENDQVKVKKPATKPSTRRIALTERPGVVTADRMQKVLGSSTWINSLSLDTANDDLIAAAKLVKSAKRIVLLVGARISTSAGIPDFRSQPGIRRLYDNNQTSLVSPEFVEHIAEVHGKVQRAEMTEFHFMLHQLSDGGCLQRVYTQNIDGLESQLSRLKDEQVVQLHGSIHNMVCTKCSTTSPTEVDQLGQHCSVCTTRKRPEKLRSSSLIQAGILRPRISRYNEETFDAEQTGDVMSEDETADVDLFLVAGTTLKVPNALQFAKRMASKVRANNGKIVWLSKDKNRLGKVADFDLTGVDCEKFAATVRKGALSLRERFAVARNPKSYW